MSSKLNSIKNEIKTLKKEMEKPHEADFKELAIEEIKSLEEKMKNLDNDLEDEIFERDSNSDKNIIMDKIKKLQITSSQ